MQVIYTRDQVTQFDEARLAQAERRSEFGLVYVCRGGGGQLT